MKANYVVSYRTLCGAHTSHTREASGRGGSDVGVSTYILVDMYGKGQTYLQNCHRKSYWAYKN